MENKNFRRKTKVLEGNQNINFGRTTEILEGNQKFWKETKIEFQEETKDAGRKTKNLIMKSDASGPSYLIKTFVQFKIY